MKKKFIICLIILLLLLPIGITFSRYVIQNIKDYIMEANNFFFNSDKLVYGGITYNINNWGGSTDVPVQFEINNHKNNILTSQTDIEYDLNVTKSEDILVSLVYDEGTETQGVIQKEEKTEKLTLIVTPTRVFNTGESATVTVKARSSSPYIKELSATFVITVGRKGISYEIVDSVGSPYLMFKVTDALDKYKVVDPWGDYTLNYELTMTEYSALSPSEKARCAAAVITLSFDPSVVILDTTSEILEKSTYTTSVYNGVSYINSITFYIDVLSSEEIRFYKRNASANYTYPITNPTPIVTFSAS